MQYAFRSRWTIAAPRARVIEALVDAAGYPQWWSRVKSVTIDGDGVHVVVRAVLPYSLTFTASYALLDDGTLAADLAGDIEGSAQWTVVAHDDRSTMLYFRQSVLICRPLLQWLSLVFRPAFRLNHWLMMRSGQKGLRTHLADQDVFPT